MLMLQAPLPGLVATTVLPNPQFNDSHLKQHSVTIKRAMDGTCYTHVQTTDGRHKLTYEIRMSRMKALELRGFITAYFSSQMRLTNHKGEIWRVWLVSNPFEFNTAERADGQPGNEFVVITIECEGFLISAPALPSC
jgi:hypothetical protein